MGALSARRSLEWLLGFYFLSHIPITLLLDLQMVLSPEYYPAEVRAMVLVAEFGVPLHPLPSLSPTRRPNSAPLAQLSHLPPPPAPRLPWGLSVLHASPQRAGANTLFLFKKGFSSLGGV